MKNKYNNCVILNTKKNRKKHKKFWKKQTNGKSDLFSFRRLNYYYGFSDSVFVCINKEIIDNNDLKIITLPKKKKKIKYPCMMEVWDDKDRVQEFVVSFDLGNDYEYRYAVLGRSVSENGFIGTYFKHAKPIKENK